MRPEQTIWIAIVFSTVIYAFIAYIAPPIRSHGSFESSVRAPLVLVLYAMALAGFVAGTTYSIIARAQPQRVRMIVSLALYEACAIFGLIAAFIISDWRLYLAPWALAVVGFLRVFPSFEGPRDTE
ncbi:MAG TPA: hypothetical protein VGK04_00980 [Thermoanaerobaculia bacterium]|jgi:hypothetical protein